MEHVEWPCVCVCVCVWNVWNVCVCVCVCGRDALITSAINCCTSFFSGFIIFMILGYMAETTNQDIDKVATEGTHSTTATRLSPFPSQASFRLQLQLSIASFHTCFPSSKHLAAKLMIT